MDMAVVDKMWRTLRRIPAIVLSLFFCFPTPSFAEASCGLEHSAAPENLNQAIKSMQSGDYRAFVMALEAKGKSPPEDSLELADDLESYASEGFSTCVVLREDVRPNSQSFFILFKDGETEDERVVFVFFMMARIDGVWLFVKTQVSTNFDEVYQFVR